MNTAMFTSVRFSSPGIKYHLLPAIVQAVTPHFTVLLLNLPKLTSTRGVVANARRYTS